MITALLPNRVTVYRRVVDLTDPESTLTRTPLFETQVRWRTLTKRDPTERQEGSGERVEPDTQLYFDPGTTIQLGDLVQLEGGNQYHEITAIQPKRMGGPNAPVHHLEAQCRTHRGPV